MKYLFGFLVSCLLGPLTAAETQTQVSQPKEQVSYPNYRNKIFEALEQQENLKQTRDFSGALLDAVVQEVNKSACSQEVKDRILEVLTDLREHGVYERSGSDEECRPVFVGIQGAVEAVIAEKLRENKLAGSVSVIYTPRPPTPLCVSPGKVDDSVAASGVIADSQRLATIESRAQIVRSYLKWGGKLYVVFPEKGVALRTEEQQAIFRQVQQKYPGELFVKEIDSKTFKKDQVGAAYKISSWNSYPILFSIKATQAMDAQTHSNWKLWFGPIYDGSVFAQRWAGFAKEAE